MRHIDSKESEAASPCKFSSQDYIYNLTFPKFAREDRSSLGMQLSNIKPELNMRFSILRKHANWILKGEGKGVILKCLDLGVISGGIYFRPNWITSVSCVCKKF